VLRWCTERGHSVVSSGDVDAAMDELMPYQRVMRRLGEVAATLESAEAAMAAEAPLQEARAVCRVCGYAARSEQPVACPVCGGGAEQFERIDAAVLLSVAAGEGDASEVGFDGHKLGWTMDARALLHELPAGYLRRRVKAIVEKSARTRRLPAITRDAVEPYVLPELDALDGRAGPHRAPIASADSTGTAAPRRIAWTAEAESRLERIPSGFLRNLAREQVERLAMRLRAGAVTALHVEAGIAEARAQMQQALGRDARSDTAAAPGGCPVHAASNGHGATPATSPEPAAAACPVHAASPEVSAAFDAVAERARDSGRVDPERAVEMTAAAAQARAQLRGLNEVTAGFVESLGKKLGYGHPASPLTYASEPFTWTEAAQQRLQSVPEFCREMVRWRVEWFATKRGLGTVITPEMVEDKLAAWGEVSQEIQARGSAMPWTDSARSRLQRIPESVRGEVMQAVEGNARAAGADTVDDSHLDAMREQWARSGDFHQGRFGFRA
jgi:rubredoxin